MAILDFSKAFDTVPHRRLLWKLSTYGINGPTLRCIEAFLVDRVQRVVVEGFRSQEDKVLSGVPYGTVLEPCLFLVCFRARCVEVNQDGPTLHTISSPRIVPGS